MPWVFQDEKGIGDYPEVPPELQALGEGRDGLLGECSPLMIVNDDLIDNDAGFFQYRTVVK